MKNTFFSSSLDTNLIKERLIQLRTGKVGFYSVGLYPASLAYNCAMQSNSRDLLLAPRPGRDLLGAFDQKSIEGMDSIHLKALKSMASKEEDGHVVYNTLADLINKCDLVILSANSNYIEQDLEEAIKLREELDQPQVVLACLAGSFCSNTQLNTSYVLCEKQINLGFFSGFHRHGALRNPLDSFTANFCHPNALTAMLGANLLDKLSPNIQVSSGVHNLEGQYLKAAKNMSSIFAGFAFSYHEKNEGLLPTVLTLLLDQCLDQAATVSMSRLDRNSLYNNQPFALTELGYGVQSIQATIQRSGEIELARDHTFSQLTAMVADVKGSMMLPNSGKPTRNFQAGQIFAKNLLLKKRCPYSIDELYEWCLDGGLQKGALEGLKSLRLWPSITKKYSIQTHDSSMINLLYLSIFGDNQQKDIAYLVLTQSRELTNYCQESVRPSHSRRYNQAINQIENTKSLELLVNAALFENTQQQYIPTIVKSASLPLEADTYQIMIKLIDKYFS